MTAISKNLVGILFGGAAAQALASAAWKGNLNAVYGFTSAGTGYQVFKPGNSFNSLTQLVPDGMYILDVAAPGFELPGAVLTASAGGGASPADVALQVLFANLSATLRPFAPAGQTYSQRLADFVAANRAHVSVVGGDAAIDYPALTLLSGGTLGGVSNLYPAPYSATSAKGFYSYPDAPTFGWEDNTNSSGNSDDRITLVVLRKATQEVYIQQAGDMRGSQAGTAAVPGYNDSTHADYCAYAFYHTADNSQYSGTQYVEL